MAAEKDIFSNAILTAIGNHAKKIKDKEIVGFLARKGIFYKGDLMVVGRAVNGGDTDYFKRPADFSDSKSRVEYAEKVWTSGLISKDGVCPMHWVSDFWGNTKNEYKYNTLRSAFWRAIKGVTAGLGVTSDHVRWPSHLVWSNLYKVAPSHGGNPNSTLCNIQLPGCIELLQFELNTYKPSHLLFLTGMGWARPFIDKMNVHVQVKPSFNYVEEFGHLFLIDGKQVKFAVASHPQGKPGTSLVDEVLQVLRSV